MEMGGRFVGLLLRVLAHACAAHMACPQCVPYRFMTIYVEEVEQGRSINMTHMWSLDFGGAYSVTVKDSSADIIARNLQPIQYACLNLLHSDKIDFISTRQRAGLVTGIKALYNFAFRNKLCTICTLPRGHWDYAGISFARLAGFEYDPAQPHPSADGVRTASTMGVRARSEILLCAPMSSIYLEPGFDAPLAAGAQQQLSTGALHVLAKPTNGFLPPCRSSGTSWDEMTGARRTIIGAQLKW